MRLERYFCDNLHCGVAQLEPTKTRMIPAVKFFIFCSLVMLAVLR